MRELSENKSGVHFRPSAHCGYVEVFSANRIPGPAGDCCWHRVTRHVPVAGCAPAQPGGRRSRPAGRILDRDAQALRAAPLIGKSAGFGGAQTTGRWMDDSVETPVAGGPAPNRAGWLAPALIPGVRLAEEHELASRQPEADMAAFVRGARRAVAPAVGPRAASLSLESSPTPHRSADRGGRVLPTYLRHQEVSA
jgi:hypothetical protein